MKPTNEKRYKDKQFLARMKYSTYLKLRRQFPAARSEPASSYFERLAEYLKSLDCNLIVGNFRK
jgi:hypothetical protein